MQLENMNKPPVLAQTSKPSIWTVFVERCRRAVVAFSAPYSISEVKFDNGMVVDLTTKSLVIPGDLSIHTTGNLTFSSDQHVIIKSGCTPEERDGYVHGIWLNPSLDEHGRPIMEDDDIEYEDFDDDSEQSTHGTE